MIAGIRTRPAVRAAVIALYVVAVEWTRALAARQPDAAITVLVLGGAALVIPAMGWPPEKLGLGTAKLGLRLLGGLALGAVLLLPAAVREGAPFLPSGFAFAAIVVAIGEEVAFRGALFAALDEAGGAPLAITGTTVLWTFAHVLSHPPEFLVAVAAAGLLLGLWRWACKDLVGPIVGHVIADLAL